MTLRGRRVLVTGGAGFVGSHLVDALVAEGAHVIVLDNLKTGSLENLVDAWGSIRFIEADVRDREAVEEAVQGQEIVFHLAANANVPYSVQDPVYDFEANVLGGYNVIRSCLESGVQRLVYASTAAVYGNPSYTPMDEGHLLNPISPYGASKLAVEHLGFAYHKTYGLAFTAIRISNTYGERLSKYVMYDLLAKLHRDPDHLEVLGDGEQRRDFCYITDTCQYLLLAAQAPQVCGEALNLAGGGPVSIKGLVELILELLGLNNRTKVTFTGESWQGDIAMLLVDDAKIRRLLGFTPQVSLREGLLKLIYWLETRQGWKLSLLKSN